jgi:hypothetical protein
MPHEVMRFWIKWHDKLIHPYLLVGYLLLPNQTIMAHAQQNRSALLNRAVVTLIKRLIVNPLLVGKEKNWALSHAITMFWARFGYFHNKKKMFRPAYMWDTQAKDHTLAF